MAKMYFRLTPTGGTSTDLDGIDGAVLADGDGAIVVDFASNEIYVYSLDADSGAAENSPYIVEPDTNAGNKRWILIPISGATVVGTSTTSLSIGTGAKVFTTQADLGWGVGNRLRAASNANPSTHYMIGTVTAYSGTTLTLDVDIIAGSGTRADWTITITGEEEEQFSYEDIWGSPQAKTLSSGVMTVAGSGIFLVSPESGDADDLISISGGSIATTVQVMAATGKTITAVHDGANLFLQGGADCVLTAYDILVLRTNDGTVFYEVNRSKNAAYA